MKTLLEVSVNNLSKNGIVMNNHVIHKVNENNDGSLKIRAQIAPHGNRDKERDSLKTDLAQCPPTGIRILASIATIIKWAVSKIDFVSAFLQIGDAKRDVCIITPCE